MKVIHISDDSTTLATLLEAAQHENLVLRTADGLEFILAELDDFNREIELTRQNAELMELLDRRAGETKAVPAAEARARLLD